MLMKLPRRLSEGGAGKWQRPAAAAQPVCSSICMCACCRSGLKGSRDTSYQGAECGCLPGLLRLCCGASLVLLPAKELVTIATPGAAPLHSCRAMLLWS